MLRQPFSDRLIAVGIAATMHVALGCALFLAAQAGVVAPATADNDSGRAIVVQLVPLDRPAPTLSRTGAEDDQKVTATRLLAGPRLSGAAAPSPIHVATAAEQMDVRAPSSVDALASDVQARAMANLPSAEYMAFRARLQAHLARYRLYPADAKDAGSQGIVSLHFIMDRGGNLIQAWVETSSGVPSIDREALNAVRRAVPLPPLPQSFPETLDIRVPVSFTLS